MFHLREEYFIVIVVLDFLIDWRLDGFWLTWLLQLLLTIHWCVNQALAFSWCCWWQFLCWQVLSVTVFQFVSLRADSELDHDYADSS